MARTDIDINSVGLNADGSVSETIVAAGATGTAGYAIDGLGRDSDAILTIRNAGSATGVFTIKSGDYCNASQGDLNVEVAPGGKSAVKLDGARFRTSDGKYNLDVAGVTGIVSAVK